MSIYLGNTLMAGSQPNAANKDLSNVSVVGQKLVAGWGMPSSRNITLTSGSSGTTYTAPANGYFFVRVQATSASSSWATLKNNKSSIVAGLDHSRNSSNFYGCVPALKGDTATLQYGSANVEAVIFIYAEGEQ